MSEDQLPINLFDLLVLVVLVAGLVRGRKQGMSEELLNLAEWITIVIGCALAYRPLGEFMEHSSGVFDVLSCYLMGYLAAGLLIHLGFSYLKRRLGGKLLGSDIFGQAEYYLGMGSGMIRFGCVLVAALALLNARGAAAVHARSTFPVLMPPPISVRTNEPASAQAGLTAARLAMARLDARQSDYVPTFSSIQDTVFERSLFGSWIENNLGFLLIERTRPEGKKISRPELNLP